MGPHLWVWWSHPAIEEGKEPNHPAHVEEIMDEVVEQRKPGPRQG